MADENKKIYITKSGRSSKQKFNSLNFKNREQMVLTRDDEERDSMSQRSQLEKE